MRPGPGASGSVSAPYPTRWEADVLTLDGSVMRVRPVCADDPADGDAIRAMHRRMSSRSRYLRYFSAVGELSDAQLKLFTDVDYRSRVCLVAVDGDDIVAAGTYHAGTGDPGSAALLAPAPLDRPAASQPRPDLAAPSARSAEVAFAVQDDQQGRGLGSILLEHLAAAAQECGIGRFTAEVLSENQAMLRVFLDAGYAVQREYASGVVDLAFDISPTAASREVLIAREQRAEARSIARLLSPRSVAVIGASNDPAKIGHAMLVNLLRSFAGPVYPVNPESLSVQGVRAYADVMGIPDPVDLAVVAVPAAGVAEVMRACRQKGVHGLVVVSAGFADAGEDGATAQHTLVRLARASGMRVLGPNCLGLANTDPAVRLNATLAPVVPAAGRVGFFCQSGALGIAILADAAARGLGLSSFVSAGNRADVSGNDLLQFWQTDDRTEVVLLYLESFGNPRKFARLARVLARSKPVIAVKSGRHALLPEGLQANVSPISDAAVASLFAQSGVIRTDTLSQAFDVALLLACQPLPAGDVVAVIGNSTALGLLAFDACLDAGLTVAGGAPVDLGASVSPDDMAAAVAEAVAGAARSGVGAVLVVFVPPVATDGAAHAEALRSAVHGAQIPVLSTFLAVEGVPEHLAVSDGVEAAARGSVPSYRSPERAVAALAAAARYAEWLRTPPGVVAPLADLDRASARRLVAAIVPPSGERPMADAEMVEILRCYGIPVTDFSLAGGRDEAVAAATELGFPVVLKASDESLRHREDRIGVRLDLADPSSVAAAYAALAAATGPQVYVQRAVHAADRIASAVFGVMADPSFGALVSFGLGGVATELFDDRAYRAVPLTDQDAAELIAAPRAAPLLDGYRGAPAVDRRPLIDLAQRLSALADDLPEIRFLQLQPVLIAAAGYAVTGVTGRIGTPPAPPDERRRLR
ncbi:MAG: GNAT family N-acetyltransferase [Actinobacteria bacterium 69-20]|nr:MAG: GNAT family N-acetyltransferase [Actinobacteria bacterium 69-20]